MTLAKTHAPVFYKINTWGMTSICEVIQSELICISSLPYTPEFELDLNGADCACSLAVMTSMWGLVRPTGFRKRLHDSLARS